jgi:hypothetical protein
MGTERFLLELPVPTLTPEQRTQRARLAALTRWSRNDPVAGTERARRTFLERFENEVDPDRVLDPVERARRADCAKRAYFARLALKSSLARRRGGGPDAGAA